MIFAPKGDRINSVLVKLACKCRPWVYSRVTNLVLPFCNGVVMLTASSIIFVLVILSIYKKLLVNFFGFYLG